MSEGNISPAAVAYLAPEAAARLRIDEMLAAARWTVQSAGAVNLSAGRGVAVREFGLAKISSSCATTSGRRRRTSSSTFSST
jgi:hypothetical protein